MVSSKTMPSLVEHLLCATHCLKDIVPGFWRPIVWWERQTCTHRVERAFEPEEGGIDTRMGVNCGRMSRWFWAGSWKVNSLPAGEVAAGSCQFVFSELFLTPDRMSRHPPRKVTGWEKPVGPSGGPQNKTSAQSLESSPRPFRVTAFRQFKEKGEESVRQIQPT